MRALALLLLTASCTPVPPPPILPRLAGTAPEDRDTVILAVAGGFGVQGIGGGGWGLEARVLWQAGDDLELGAAVAGGKVDAVRWFVAPRLLGGYAIPGADWAAAAFGLGGGVTGSGLVYLTIDGGIAGSIPNDYVVPYLALGAAGSFTLVPGEVFGDNGRQSSTHEPSATALYVYASLGALVPLHLEGNAIAVDLSMAIDTLEGAGFLGASFADRQRVRTPPGTP